jgi:hypothetical protein
VVQPRSAFRDVLRDGGLRRCRFEQFQPRTADRDEVRAHALGGDLLGRFHLQPERVTVERKGGRKIFHGDADVIENCLHWCDPSPCHET